MVLVATVAIHKARAQSPGNTLQVGYTYWWTNGGPFIGLCGDEYSLVFTGTIVRIDQPSVPVSAGGSDTMYIPRNGLIKIEEMKCKHRPAESYRTKAGAGYKGQAYFSSDCFSGSGLRPGDKVIVFVYSYEGDYSIPSGSILKLKSFDDPAVRSIERYIKSGQDALAIKGDMAIWRKYGLDRQLKQIIDCRVQQKKEKK